MLLVVQSACDVSGFVSNSKWRVAICHLPSWCVLFPFPTQTQPITTRKLLDTRETLYGCLKRWKEIKKWQAEPLINWTHERLARRVEMVVIVHLCIDRYPTWIFILYFFSHLFLLLASSTERSINASTYQMTKISQNAIGSEWKKIQITEKDLFVNRGRVRWISPFKGIERKIEWLKGVDIVWKKNLCRAFDEKNIEKSLWMDSRRWDTPTYLSVVDVWLLLLLCDVWKHVYLFVFGWLAGQAEYLVAMTRRRPWPGLIPGCYCLAVYLSKLPLRFIDVDVTGWANK